MFAEEVSSNELLPVVIGGINSVISLGDKVCNLQLRWASKNDDILPDVVPGLGDSD
jgi:hypothetical protein